MPSVEEHWDSLKRTDRWTVQSHVVAALASHCTQLTVPPTASKASIDVQMLQAECSTRSSSGTTFASSIRSSGCATNAWTELLVAEDALLRRKRSLVQQPWHEELIELPASRTAKRQCWAEELADAEQAMQQCHVSAPDRAAWVPLPADERPPMPTSRGRGRGRGRGGLMVARGRAPHLSRLRGGARVGRGFGRNDMGG